MADQDISTGEIPPFDVGEMVARTRGSFQAAREATRENFVPTPEIEPQLLPADQFVFDQELDAQGHELITNDYAVSEGHEKTHLVKDNEVVVRFTGTGRQLVDLIAQMQKRPIREVNQTPYEKTDTHNRPIILRRTGLEMLVKVDANYKSTYLQPQIGRPQFGQEPSINLRFEVVGISESNGNYHIFLMKGRTNREAIDDHLNLSRSDQELASELNAQQIQGKIDQVDRLSRHPGLSKKFRDAIQPALKNGAIMLTTRGQRDTWGKAVKQDYEAVYLQGRQPDKDQQITDGNLNIVGLHLREGDFNTELPSFVVSEEVAANIA